MIAGVSAPAPTSSNRGVTIQLFPEKVNAIRFSSTFGMILPVESTFGADKLLRYWLRFAHLRDLLSMMKWTTRNVKSPARATVRGQNCC